MGGERVSAQQQTKGGAITTVTHIPTQRAREIARSARASSRRQRGAEVLLRLTRGGSSQRRKAELLRLGTAYALEMMASGVRSLKCRTHVWHVEGFDPRVHPALCWWASVSTPARGGVECSAVAAVYVYMGRSRLQAF